MSFPTDEMGAESRPIELYTIIADSTTLRVTGHKGGLIYDGNLYAQAVVSRRGIGREAGPGNSQALEVLIERGILDDYAFGVPPQTWSLTIRRVQPTGSQLLWSGNINHTSLQQDGSILLRSASIADDQLKRRVPGHIVSRLCPHALYGSVCRASSTGRDTAATVSAVDGLTLTVSAVGGGDGYHDLGDIEFAGQRRMIVSQVGTSIEIDYPFEGLVATNAVVLWAGCIRDLTTCDTKYGNRDNFGGFPFTPLKNIYRVGIKAMGV